MLNPALSTILEDTRHACSLKEIRMIEFDSYRHGYAPDDCPVLDDVFAMLQERGLPVKVFSRYWRKGLAASVGIVYKKISANTVYLFAYGML